MVLKETLKQVQLENSQMNDSEHKKDSSYLQLNYSDLFEKTLNENL